MKRKKSIAAVNYGLFRVQSKFITDRQVLSCKIRSKTDGNSGPPAPTIVSSDGNPAALFAKFCSWRIFGMLTPHARFGLKTRHFRSRSSDVSDVINIVMSRDDVTSRTRGYDRTPHPSYRRLTARNCHYAFACHSSPMTRLPCSDKLTIH